MHSSAASYVAAGTGVARRSSGAAAAGDGVAMRVASAGRHGGRGSMRRRHPPLVVEQLLRGRVGERGGGLGRLARVLARKFVSHFFVL